MFPDRVILLNLLAIVALITMQLEAVQSSVPDYPQFADRVQLSCKTGYRQTGTKTLSCTGRRCQPLVASLIGCSDWSITVPVCQPVGASSGASCPNPGFPLHWGAAKASYPHGHVKNIFCKTSNMDMDMSPILKCVNGRWSGPVPTCRDIRISITKSSGCGNTYESSNPPGGEIMSPGYPSQDYGNDKQCHWKISSNSRIGLWFKTFRTESVLDTVKVYDGGSASAPLLGTFSGSRLPPYITSKSNQLYITFTTDGSLGYKGFAASYRALGIGTLRLVNGTSRSGRVEVYMNKEWGTICDDAWDITDAGVFCRHLGFPGAVSAYTNLEFGAGTGKIWLDDHVCTGAETHFLKCNSRNWGEHDCGHSEDAGVKCQKRVKLVNGGASYGRVEVYHAGQWGTVCDDAWDMDDANVVCRELGFSRATNAYTDAHYGQGTGPIWIDETSCLGTEDSLLSCGFRGWISNNQGCSHSEDVGVKCV
ncbi:putative DMBT1-like protein [Actinia tenebrosa]|uniref:DMBT1-like protein n=1 Tax=Actinia tenebrosa TaxID=6105 RepID=A0A6P8ITM2_ACTTE|nr:putative DMBT1-like protein [Actinia tenebrosa]